MSLVQQFLNEGAYFPNYETSLHTDLVLKTKEVVPAGTVVRVDFNTDKDDSIKLVLADRIIRLPTELAFRYVDGFSRPPKMRQLQQWADEGYCLTVIGNKVNTNGYGPNGDPSWMIALGYTK